MINLDELTEEELAQHWAIVDIHVSFGASVVKTLQHSSPPTFHLERRRPTALGYVTPEEYPPYAWRASRRW